TPNGAGAPTAKAPGGRRGTVMPEHANQGEGPWPVNQRTGEARAARVELAVTRPSRRTGLLGRDAFEASSALIIAPCFSIHTMFMRFDIDAVFVDDDGRAVKVVNEMAPWR